MIFPYRKYKDPEGNLVQLPIVSVRVKCNGVMLPIWALLDSGADITLLNMSFAYLFNVDFKKSKKIEVFGALALPPSIHQGDRPLLRREPSQISRQALEVCRRVRHRV